MSSEAPDAMHEAGTQPSATTDLPTVWSVLHGSVHSLDGSPVNVTQLTARLRAASVMAAVPAHASEDSVADLSVFVTHASRDGEDVQLVGLLRDRTLVPGPELSEFANELAGATQSAVVLDGDWFDDDQDLDSDDSDEENGDEDTAITDEIADAEGGWADELDAEPDPDLAGDVVVSRQAESALPMLAHGTQSVLTAGNDGGWTLVQFADAWVDVSSEGWLPSELPVVHLTRVNETERRIQVLTSFMQTVPHLLHRTEDLVPVLDTAGLPKAMVQVLLDPNLADDSALLELLESKHFDHIPVERVAAALRSPMDDMWTSRVLESLDLPVIAADIHEGLTHVPDGTLIRPSGLVQSMGEMISRYYDAPRYEVAARSFIGKSYAAVTSTPARTVLTATASGVMALASFAAAGRTSGWRAKALGFVGAMGVMDVAGHALLAPKKFRRD